VLSWVIGRSWSGLTGGEILAARGHCGGVEGISTDRARA
jgi:hypothetical protein